MVHRAQPFGREYFPELALGVLAVLGAAYLLADTSRRSRQERTSLVPSPRASPERTPAEIADPAEVGRERNAPQRRAESVAAPAREEVEQDASSARVPPTPSEQTAPERVEVLVRDVQGRPVPGIALELDLETLPSSSGPNLLLDPTDARGLSAFPLEICAAPSWTVERYWFVLRARVPHPDPPWIDLGSRPAPGLVALTLPLAGAARVRVVDEDGIAIEDGAGVYAVVRGVGTRDVRASADVLDGSAEFPWIPIETSLELRASYHDQRASSERLTLRGPAYPGETVEGELRLRPWPVLRFRVLDERGEPLGSTSLWMRVSLPPLSPQTARVATSATGVVELQLVGRHDSERERLLEIVTEHSPDRSAELVLPMQLVRAAPTELGDVVLRRRPGWR